MENIDTTAIYSQKLSKMIQCETISEKNQQDRSKFYAFHRLLEELFPNVHERMEKFDFNGSLLFKLASHSPTNRPILIMAHFDVVEATGTWLYPPFSGEIANGRIWGRGTQDTKGLLFAQLQALEELLGDDSFSLSFDLYLATSCTEEVGGDGGVLTAEFLSEQGVDFAFILDEGGAVIDEPIKGVKGRFATIGVAEKGTGNVRFIARSKGGHSSAPPKNFPIPRLAALIRHIEEHDPFKSEIIPEVRELFQNIAPFMAGINGIALQNLKYTEHFIKKLMPRLSPVTAAMLKTSIAFTMQSGSQGSNVLPLEASVTANLRYISHQNMEESLEILQKIADKYGVEMENLGGRPASKVTSTGSKGYLFLQNAIEEHFKGSQRPPIVTPYVMTGATDTRFYAHLTDCILRFSPILMSNSQFSTVHAENENVFSQALPPAVEFFKRIINNYENSDFLL